MLHNVTAVRYNIDGGTTHDTPHTRDESPSNERVNMYGDTTRPNIDKHIRIPLTDDQRDELAGLLKAVPSRTVPRFDWNNPAGRAFVRRLREVQQSGVPLNWIATDLGVGTPTLNGAIGYYERTSATRGVTEKNKTLPEATEGGDGS